MTNGAMVNDVSIPFVASGSYPARSGNDVRALIDGEPAFRRICEAIEAARRSVRATVAFMWPDFEMPDGRGSALDVLDRAAARGVDVRVIFWRPDAETEGLKRNAFWGAAGHFAALEARGSGVRIRWDRAHPGFCQHQKSWLIDAGDAREVAFVGGINLNPHSMVVPGHRGEGQNHDVYVELAGPSVVDVHHNFVQRWNEASERNADDGRWGSGSETDLPFPDHVPARRGDEVVQIQRTIHAGRYVDGRSPPGGVPFDIASGEGSILDQYRLAIGAARRSIYLENQYVAVPGIVDDLHMALRRGVEVVLLMPAEPEATARGRDQPGQRAFLEARMALGGYENFTLAGIAGMDAGGRRKPVYVHAKLMVVDGAWATVGSCNLHGFSLFGNGEMNVAFHGGGVAWTLLSALLREHLDHDVAGMDDVAALRLFRRIAIANRKKLETGDHAWQGLAFALDPATHWR